MGVGNQMSNISDQMAVAIVIFSTFAVFLFMAWREERRNKLWDEAWRAGYEQGMKVIRSNVQ
jgi:preprotein translocase subunit YajC